MTVAVRGREELAFLFQFDRLIRWAINGRLCLLQWDARPHDLDDLVQETYLRLVRTLQNQDIVESLPSSYFVQAARWTVMDLFRAAIAARRRAVSVGSTGSAVPRRPTAQSISAARRAAAEARWSGHRSARSPEVLAKDRERGRAARERKRLAEAGAPIPPHLQPRKKLTEDEARARKRECDRQYRAARRQREALDDPPL